MKKSDLAIVHQVADNVREPLVRRLRYIATLADKELKKDNISVGHYGFARQIARLARDFVADSERENEDAPPRP